MSNIDIEKPINKIVITKFHLRERMEENNINGSNIDIEKPTNKIVITKFHLRERREENNINGSTENPRSKKIIIKLKNTSNIRFDISNICRICEQEYNNNLNMHDICWEYHVNELDKKFVKIDQCNKKRGSFCKNDHCYYCFHRSFSSHHRSQFLSNNQIDPRYVSKASTKKFWFDCHVCHHSFYSQLSNISCNKWCPYCAHQKLCNDINCQDCYEKSFDSHKKAQFWSQINQIKPRYVFKNSNNKYWFDCDQCKHSFDSILSQISKGSGCPYCKYPCGKICGDINCHFCYAKSFASYDKAIYWSKKNGDIQPVQVILNSIFKYWFDCHLCCHSFESELHSIVRGSWCPYCSHPPKKLCNDDCVRCYEKSFASHEKSKYWSDKNGEIKPRNVFKNSENKYLFNCDQCQHLFTATTAHINFGRWCPKCKNKTEFKLFNWLSSSISFDIQREAKFDWCKSQEKNKHLPFDFLIENLKLIIELDGLQHFKQVMDWTAPKHTIKRDIFKMETALKNGYSIIRLLQENVYENKNNWDIKLKSILNRYQNPIILFIDNDDIYTNHKAGFCSDQYLTIK